MHPPQVLVSLCGVRLYAPFLAYPFHNPHPQTQADPQAHPFFILEGGVGGGVRGCWLLAGAGHTMDHGHVSDAKATALDAGPYLTIGKCRCHWSCLLIFSYLAIEHRADTATQPLI
jgi:hypothetical protein